MRYSTVVAPLLAARALLSPAAWAAPPAREPPAQLAMMAGAASAMIPTILGATMASGGITYAEKDRGMAVIGAGFILPPLVSHAVLGEWTRGAIFSIAPALSEIGMVWLMAGRPDAVFRGNMLSRTTFGALLCADIFFSALGVADAALAGNQNPTGRWAVVIAPTVAANRIGITVGGPL